MMSHLPDFLLWVLWNLYSKSFCSSMDVFLFFRFLNWLVLQKLKNEGKKILLFLKSITTCKISVLKMVPAEFPVHFLLLLSINQAHCRLVGVLATKYRIRNSEKFLWASKASRRTWTLPEIMLFHKPTSDNTWAYRLINFANFLLRLKLVSSFSFPPESSLKSR